uniref:Uncharacterized protein n=1 Tax=Romanomermis culicivorax TaxID=13658 RepID=A0A915JY46_ROMCU
MKNHKDVDGEPPHCGDFGVLSGIGTGTVVLKIEEPEPIFFKIKNRCTSRIRTTPRSDEKNSIF